MKIRVSILVNVKSIPEYPSMFNHDQLLYFEAFMLLIKEKAI